MAKQKHRTDKEIVEQTNELARQFYKQHGYDVRKGYRFDKSSHPQEIGAWNMACTAQIFLTDTDPDDALSSIE